MSFVNALRLVSIMLALFNSALLPIVLLSWWWGDGIAGQLFFSWLLQMLGCAAVYWFARHQRRPLALKESFIVVVLYWLGGAVSAAVPIVWVTGLSITNGFFEAMSAITTTGATVLSGLDAMAPSFLLYRQLLQWLGGMGIIVMAIAILPATNVGGMKLFKAEIPGPEKEQKITPRIQQTAQYLWGIYVGGTLLCAALYWLAGMSLFDAVAHALTTLSTGGFSTHDASMGYFDNVWIELISVVFMLVGGVNFTLHYVLISRGRLNVYWQNPETRFFILFIAVVTLFITFALALTHSDDWLHGLRTSLFQVVSFITSTGYATVDINAWPLFAPVLLVLIGFVGGCAGSTAGGMKVIRVLLMMKNGMREMATLVHPNQIVRIKIESKVVSDNLIEAVQGFVGIYLMLTALLTLVMVSTGLDPVTAFSAVGACLNDLGPGVGDLASSFSSVSDAGKWVMAFTMLLGRLELFTLLVILTPQYWRS